ncbi:F1 ATPase assembly protein [Ceratobasidium sp. AG-Ba]|nr:F1 ATPase assembly protein [Ceratobasidium sp. AG-Ba]
MSTQEAKERAETRAAAKGKAKEAQVVAPSPSKPHSSMGPPAKPGQTPAQTPSKPAAASTAATPAPKNNTNAPTTPADVPSVTPLKRGPGRPRKSEKIEPTGPPPLKRLRGRPRNSTAPAANTRQKARDEVAEESDGGEYHGTDESSLESVPDNIISQYAAHVSILRTKLDSRGIPEQYSVFKSFWVPIRSPYFDGGASGPPARFLYWDPLFITSVACPVCQQPLAIAAGGGWLDEPLSMRDHDGPCWIIGRRYVCTQCFAATEVAASGPADEDKSQSQVDYSSPVYYISWEKRFRDLLPETLAGEFPTRVKKRAAKEKEKEKEKEDEEEGEEDADAEGDAEEAGARRRSAKRMRHCMKCGSQTCQGRMGRSRCPNVCYDCKLTDCNGRPKPNLTCKGDATKTFKELAVEEAQSPLTEVSAASAPAATTPGAPTAASASVPAPAADAAPATSGEPTPTTSGEPAPTTSGEPAPVPAPAPHPSNWPAGLPEVPPGFVLAIPYAIGTDGRPAGAGPGMAYLVPKGDIPGFLPAPPPVPVSAAKPDTPAAAPAEPGSSAEPGPASTTTADAPQAAPPAQPAPKRNPPRTKATPQKAAAQSAPQQIAPAPAPTPPRGHHSYPPPPGMSYHPHPPPHPHHSGGSESNYYGGYYAPYGYPPPYGFGFYAPYPPQHQHPENGGQQQHPPPPPGHPQSQYYPGQPGYGGPQPHPGPGYAGPPGPYPPEGPAHPSANGYPPPPGPGPAPPPGFHQQPQQYIAYQPHVPVTIGPGPPASKKRKTGAAAAESDKTT